jgi:peptidoglycan/LPS O-acetylase OafA/YrhL
MILCFHNSAGKISGSQYAWLIQMGHRKIGLDYIRATAILLVLMAHAFHGRSDKFDVLGFLGVEIFFVLSGYLIGGILLASIARHQNVISLRLVKDFWVRRWMRTMPNYLLFLPVYMYFDHVGFQKQLFYFLTFTQNLVRPFQSSFYSLSWSLTIEEWFYTLFPLITLGLFKLFRHIRPAFLTSVSLLFVIPLILRITFGPGHSWDDCMRKIVVFRLDALMWGVSLAALQRYRPTVFSRLCKPVLLIVGIAGIVGVALWVTMSGCMYTNATPVDALMFDAASFCCAIALPFCSTIEWSDSWISRAAVFTSLWSYSLYLCHIAVFHLVVMARSYIPQRGAVAILQWVAAYAVAAAVFYGFERPILRLRDRLTEGRRAPKPIEVATAV